MTSYPFYVDSWMEHTRPTPNTMITTKEYRILCKLELEEFESIYFQRTGLQRDNIPLELKKLIGLTVYRCLWMNQKYSQSENESIET